MIDIQRAVALGGSTILMQGIAGFVTQNGGVGDHGLATGFIDKAHAAAMGAIAEAVSNPAELGEAFKRAKAADRTSVIVMKVDAYEGWTQEGHAWWEVGTPHVTDNEKVRAAHVDWESTRSRQRRGV